MAQNKRYYWLKLKEDFFEDETIQFIESQTNGIKYSNFYLKLLLKSIRNDGYLIRHIGEKYIPYDIDALARLTNCDFDTVKSAMNLFSDIGIIKKMETGEIYLSQIEEMIGTETSKAESMRKLRAKRNKQKELGMDQEGNNVTDELPEVTKSYTEKEKEKELELDTDKENKKRSGNDHITQSLSLIQENYFNQITPIKLESLTTEIEQLGENAVGIISVAIDYTKEKGKNLNYLTKVINNWADDNVKTVEDAKAKINGNSQKQSNSWISDELEKLRGEK